MNERPAMTPLETTQLDRLLYGADATPWIVAAEPAGPNRMRIFQRTPAGGTETAEVPFEPWLLAARAEPWAAIRPQPRIDGLAGDHALRYLVRFSSWPDYLDASRGASESGESFFRFRSPVEQHLVSSGRTLFNGMTFDDVRRLQLDIETTGFDAAHADVEVIIVAISMSNGHEEVLVQDGDEADLLRRLSQRIIDLDPDTIEGHNLFNFDLPFLATRASRYDIPLNWGRDGSALRIAPNQARFKVGALTLPYTPAYIHGRHIIDTYQQIQRYDTAGRLSSYGLKPAVEQLGLTRPDREFVPGEQIRELWTTDRDRLLRYALDDVRDVDILARLATPTEFYQTQILPRSFQNVATGGPGEKINDVMVRAYLMHGHSVPTARAARDYPGGHAELLATGVFRPVVKCDVESLYPSIMLVEGVSSGADTLGTYLPMLSDLTRRRLEAKARSRTTTGAERAMWDGLQGSFKVLINSFYGYLGYGGGLFNDFDAAERVTLSGQRLVRQVVDRLHEAGAIPIEVDTDGVYFVPPAEVRTGEDEEQFIERIGEVLPAGIRLAHDGHYDGMLSLRLKTYALLNEDGTLTLKGSALRSRRMERCLRRFLEEAARHFLAADRDGARTAYFALAERLRDRQLAPDEFAQWGMVNEETAAKQPRLQRLMARARAAGRQPVRSGERLELYERDDGEFGFIDEYNSDESVGYLLRRLRGVAERFRGLFEGDSEFDAFFPLLTPRTDLAAARDQEASQQLTMFG
jgi:DNA polymerase I